MVIAMENDRLPYLREKTKTLTLAPGCYLMRNKQGLIIYVGKAKSLKKRVTSYFRQSADHLPKVEKMVSQVYDYDYIVTDSEFEALVLECSLIKQHSPKYNILLKDDKGFHYIRISSGSWGRISAAKQTADDGATYIGPYVSSFAVTQVVEEANTAFRLPNCSRQFPQDFKKGRPCLNYHIKRCMGVCSGRISEREYAETLSQAIAYMRSDSASTIKLLTEQMEEASEQLQYERAARLRDRIEAIRRISEHQKVMYNSIPDQDVVALAQGPEQAYAVVLHFRGHRLVDKESFPLGEQEALTDAREEFLVRYYSAEREIPHQVSLDGEVQDRELVERFLSERAGRKCILHLPQRGEQVRVVEMAKTNAAELIGQESGRVGKDIAALDELARLLGLGKAPEYIEAYDISNLGSSSMVAGMVVFEKGKPLKSAYKRFAIKSLEEQNDYGAMSEVITRRLNRYFEQKETGQGFGRLPDLILLDGGKGHVATIAPILEASGLKVPLYGMVKDDRHRTRAIAESGGEIAVTSHKAAFHLLTRIQDEVHRFAIEYQRAKHQKTGFSSTLSTIEGVGPKRAMALMRQMKTLRAIREADAATLAQVPGMTRTAAQKVYEYFHPPEKQDEPRETC